MALLHFFWISLLALVWAYSSTVAADSSAEPRLAPTETRASGPIVAPAWDSFEARCERELPATSVEVNWMPGEVRYDFSRDLAALRTAGLPSPQALQSQNFLLGLTETSLGSQFTFSMNSLVDAETGRTCMRPHITVRVSAGVQKIAVANEFPQDSCAFREILNHELQHARANDNQAMLASRRLRAEMLRTLGNRVFYGERAELEGYVVNAVRDHWLPFVKKDLALVESDHAHIDRADENKRVLGSCDGEVLRILKSRLI